VCAAISTHRLLLQQQQGWSPPPPSPRVLRRAGTARGSAVLGTLSLRYRVGNHLSPDTKTIVCCAAVTGTAPWLRGAKSNPVAASACLQHGTHRHDSGPRWLSWSFGSSPGAGAGSIHPSLALLFRDLKGALQTLFKTTGSYRSTLSYIQRHSTIWLLWVDHLPPLFSNDISLPRDCNGRAAGRRHPANTSVEG